MKLRIDEIGFGDLKLWQAPEAFCYGVDAVLLAAWAAAGKAAGKRNCRIMDLGTGTGIVPLILSHKTASPYIGGLEVQPWAYALAQKNVTENHLEDRLHFFQGNVRDFPPAELAGTFDVVTANPPYTAGGSGLECKNRAMAVARQELMGSLADFLQAAATLLQDGGSFYLVHRPSRLVDIFQLCRSCRLEPKTLRLVSGKPGEAPNIALVHCTKNGKSELKIEPVLCVHQPDGSYTEEILTIYEKNIKIQ